MKKIFLVVYLLFILFLLSSINNTQNENNFIKINVIAGAKYNQDAKYGAVSFKVTPQMAFWIEDSQGKFISTIYVTYKSAKESWGLPGTRRPSSLPIWSHARGIESDTNYFMPSSKKPLPDSETGATPKISFEKIWIIPKAFKSGNYKIKAEINSSFDYNDTFKDNLNNSDQNYNEYSGQPSLLYEGTIDIGNKNTSILLKPVGYGNPAGKTGDVFKDLSKITTAIKIIDSIKVEYVSK